MSATGPRPDDPGHRYSQRRGVYLGNSLFCRSARATTPPLPRPLLRGLVGVGNECAGPRRGLVRRAHGSTIRDKDTRMEWKLNGRHRQETSRLPLRPRCELSDIDFSRSSRTFDQNTRRDLLLRPPEPRLGPVRPTVSRRRKPSSPRGQRPPPTCPSRDARPLDRLGLTEAYWTLISSVNYFRVDRGADLQTTTPADLFPDHLLHPAWAAVLTVTPKSAPGDGVERRYSATHHLRGPVDRPYLPYRPAPTSSPVVARIFESPLRQVEQNQALDRAGVEYELTSRTSTRRWSRCSTRSTRRGRRTGHHHPVDRLRKAGDQVGATAS